MEDADVKKESYGKKANPQQKSGILSNVLFCWTFPLFIKGFKKDLFEEDLYSTLNDVKATPLGDRLEQEWNKDKLSKNPSLAKVLIRVYWKDLSGYALLLLIQELVVKMAQPLLLGRLLGFYAPDNSTVTIKDAYLNAIGIVILSFVNILILHSCFFGIQNVSMRIRISCGSLIYRKSLKLSMAETTVGQVVTLLSSDVGRFDQLLLRLHHLVSAPLQIVIALYLVHATLGITAMTGFLLLVAFIPVQFYIGKKTSYYRLKTAQRTDHRVKLINEIITGIKVIKMHAWEKPFSRLVAAAREFELKFIKSNSYLRAIHIAFSMFLVRTSILICVLTYVFTGNVLKAQYVFVLTSYYNTIRQPITQHLPRCIGTMAEVQASLQRIQKFLFYREITSDNNNSVTNYANENKDKVGISLMNVSVKWDLSSEYILSDINLSAPTRQLTAIIGPVGSGKSTLLQTILGETPLTEGDISVSGRISFAQQEPWLFSNSIRQNILFGQKMDFPRYSEVIRVCALEHDLSLFPYEDKTIIGERGVMLSGGQKARIGLARAIYKEADIYLLDDPLSAVDPHVGKQIFNNCILGYLKNKTTILVTHQLQYLHVVDQICLLENGKIVTKGTCDEIQKFENDFIKLLKKQENENTENDEDEKEDFAASSGKSKFPEIVKEHRSVGKLSKRIYVKYFQAGGSCFLPLLIISFFVVTQGLASCVDYFLTFWVNVEQKKLELELHEDNTTKPSSNDIYSNFLELENIDFVYIYVTIIGMLIIMAVTSSFSFATYCVKAAKNLHEKMFRAVLFTTMRFFNTNASGRILNRFAKDISIIDEFLSLALMDTMNVGLNVIAIVFLLSTINLWLIIPTVVVFGLFYMYRVMYMPTSRSLKRLEGTTRSPIFSHLTASLQGLTTIRAFQAQNILMAEFDYHQDLNSSAVYMYRSCSRTFGLWMDITCSIYIALVILSFLLIKVETYGGNVGLAITQSITLTGTLQRGIRQWSDLENQMTSVERVIEYTDLNTEADNAKIVPLDTWPSLGKLEFDKVYLRYSANDPFVLKKLTFCVNPKEKIGIVGRTGAGKSSLLTAIFRLADINGKILIDDIDTSQVSLANLRSRIAIIPQEPVLFSGSLRKNLDPFEEYPDERLWDALQEVELKPLVSSLPLGLHSKVSEFGANFSVGQKQLLCLARALLRDNKILILDEATANVDPHTDELIQETIKRKFNDCTVLTIAHRIHTVLNSDKILAMEDGCMMEFDNPSRLMENEDGLFYKLVIQSGIKIATENEAKKDV